MYFHTPDPEGSKPTGPRVEQDLERPLRAVKGISHRRLPAALPFAVAGILVVTSFAFGATVVRSLVTPTSSATPVVVGDDDPTDSPTIAPTEVPPTQLPPTAVPTLPPTAVPTEPPTEPPTAPPTAVPTAKPTPVPTPACTITLSGGVVAISGGAVPAVAISGVPVKLNWSKWICPGYQYYGLARTETGTPSLTLNQLPPLAWIDGVNTLSFTDNGLNNNGSLHQGAPQAGHTYYYRVFVFNETKPTAAGGGAVPACYVNTIVAQSNVIKVVIPAAATPTPPHSAAPSASA